MSFLLLRKPIGYSKVDKEDPEEKIHRRAQFLINKVLERADSMGKPSYLRIKIRRLKFRFGRRLKKLKKSALASISNVKIGVYKQVSCQIRNCKSLFGRKETNFANFPALLSSWRKLNIVSSLKSSCNFFPKSFNFVYELCYMKENL